MEKLTIQYIDPNELMPYENNARIHSDSQIAQIMASITKFGFNNPILLDGDKGVIAGHGRLQAAQNLDMQKVPCVELSHLTDDEKKAYIIADNKLALNAEWNMDKLELELNTLNKLDFDVSLLGFDINELNGFFSIPDEIEEVESYNESVNIAIACENIDDMEYVQSVLGIKGKKISSLQLLDMLKED